MEEDLKKKLAINAVSAIQVKDVFLPDRLHFSKTNKNAVILGFTNEAGKEVEAKAVHLMPEHLEFLYNQIGRFLGKLS